MTKRKVDCDLNDIIGSYLREKKCEKSLKLFEEKNGQTKNDQRKKLMKFIKYLKEKEMVKENVKGDDLGFQINFGAYQPDKKVRIYINLDHSLTQLIAAIHRSEHKEYGRESCGKVGKD